MAYTDLQICDLAMTLIGVTRQVTVLGTLGDANEVHEQVAGMHYPIVRDELLAERHWGFATKREEPTADATVERDGWEYVYPLASDNIQIQQIWNGVREDLELNPTAYKIEHDATNTRRILLTDFEDPVVIYTARVAETYWPNYFVDAMAAQLAVRFAVALGKKHSLVQTLESQAAKALAKAMTQDQRATQPDKEPDSAFITGR